MTDIKMNGVTLHIDETLDSAQREGIRDGVFKIEGVVAAAFNEKTPHLMIVEFDTDRVTQAELLSNITGQGVHAELVG
ncbi:MAG: hypothetical protein KAI73_12590 [Rhodospirillaceae bacterium]|nr:hypothetical protein [Rhodospirillaceae bacterium]